MLFYSNSVVVVMGNLMSVVIFLMVFFSLTFWYLFFSLFDGEITPLVSSKVVSRSQGIAGGGYWFKPAWATLFSIVVVLQIFNNEY